MVKYCLFPVAGFGTRFLPVTKAVPKELLPILDKPLIQYAVDEAYEIGIHNLCFVINQYKLAIKNYFMPNPYLNTLLIDGQKKEKLNCVDKIFENCSLDFIHQKEMLGLGHAILASKKSIGQNTFAVILPDDFCFHEVTSVTYQLYEIYKKNQDKCIIAIEEVEPHEVKKYGVIKGKPLKGDKNLFFVEDMVEKPSVEDAPSNFAILGRYILTPEIFVFLNQTKPDKNGEIQLTDALKGLAKIGKVLAYKISAKRIDCGSVDGYIKANNFLSTLG